MTEIYLDPQFKDLNPKQVTDINIGNKILADEQKNTALPPMAPREYQYELYKKAVSENIIAVLDTGSGKTLISVMLIKHMLRIENEKRNTVPGYKVNKGET
jgi:endoribonuclease Dicer